MEWLCAKGHTGFSWPLLSVRVHGGQQVSTLGRVPKMRRACIETSGFESWLATFRDLHEALPTCLSFLIHGFRMIDSNDLIGGWLGLMCYYGKFWKLQSKVICPPVGYDEGWTGILGMLGTLAPPNTIHLLLGHLAYNCGAKLGWRASPLNKLLTDEARCQRGM